MKFKQGFIALALCAMCTNYLEPVAVHALDVNATLQKYEEMAGRFEGMAGNYGNIQQIDKNDIYKKYISSIEDSIESADIENKFKEFQNHKFSTGNTLKGTKEYINQLTVEKKLELSNIKDSETSKIDDMDNTIAAKIIAIENEKQNIRKTIEQKRNDSLNATNPPSLGDNDINTPKDWATIVGEKGASFLKNTLNVLNNADDVAKTVFDEVRGVESENNFKPMYNAFLKDAQKAGMSEQEAEEYAETACNDMSSAHGVGLGLAAIALVGIATGGIALGPMALAALGTGVTSKIISDAVFC